MSLQIVHLKIISKIFSRFITYNILANCVPNILSCTGEQGELDGQDQGPVELRTHGSVECE